jgi:Trk K+ transport system NAD-binding subunit
VLELGRRLGEAMARRALSAGASSQVVGHFDELLVAEATADGTPLVGHTLREAALPSRARLSVAGVWQGGEFRVAEPDTLVDRTTVLILAGTAEQLEAYDAQVGTSPRGGAVVVVGGGRVGRSAAAMLEVAGVDHRLVELRPDRIVPEGRDVQGDATDVEVLRRVGVEGDCTVLVTTGDDDLNTFVSACCRLLAPDGRVIARANHDRNVSTLHRAGADAVLSYASLGATAIWNLLGPHDALVLAEGLDVFRVSVPSAVAGRTLRFSGISEATGCHVVAVGRGQEMQVNPAAETVLPAEADLVLMGAAGSEQDFLARYRLQPRPWRPGRPATPPA